jgi:hypothetical protein
MKLNEGIFNAVRSGIMVGDTKPCGRVTIEPDWVLNQTEPVYDGSVRGPFRYYQDLSAPGLEIEVPNIKSISIERSLSQDIATCNITIYNQWHDSNGSSTPIPMSPELATQLGKPGYFWPQRGESVESQVLWNQEPGSGAYEKDGTYDPSFDWTNVIVPNAMIRTYQGYGGTDTSVQDAIDNENIMLTGIWLIDRITAGTDGILTLDCRDVGRLLLEQLTFPPLVPDALYPLEYVPGGKSIFDSTFAPGPRSGGVSSASFGEVRCLYSNSATDVLAGSPGGNIGINGNKGSYACDGNYKTYALSPAVAEPMDSSAYFWWEFALEKLGGSGRKIQGVTFMTWAGGYTAYISVKRNGSWTAGKPVPGGVDPHDYIKEIHVPTTVPDGNEKEIAIDFDQPIEADYIRITLGRPMYYSGQADGSGNTYRCGLKNIYARSVGDKTNSWISGDIEQPWTFAMAAHPVRGYWVAEANGYVHGFGDAADYDSSSLETGAGLDPYNPETVLPLFGTVSYDSPPLKPVQILTPTGWESRYLNRIPDGAYPQQSAISMAAHPSGEGYWILDNTGRVYCYGAARLHLGYHPGFNWVYPPYQRLDPWLYYVQIPWYGSLFGQTSITAMSIAATYTGNGYWVAYSDGSIRGFGDAVIDGRYYWETPKTALTNQMINDKRPVDITYYENPDGSAYRYGTYAVPNDDPYGYRISQMPRKYNITSRATAICSHPNKIGFWVADASGQVWGYGNVDYHGQLNNLTYNKDQADSFRLSRLDFPHGMCSTKSGDGYWLAFTSGKVAAFGDAIKTNPVDIYKDNPAINFEVPNKTLQAARDEQNENYSYFRHFVWDIDRDPDGEGFWVQISNGDVQGYNAQDWGQPGYWGKTGYRWTKGNFQEYADIIKDMLCWAGFTYYDGTFVETIKKWPGNSTFAVPTLASGQSYAVEDYILTMESGGDLVLRETSVGNPSGTIVWRSNTSLVGKYVSTQAGSKLRMQSDGNLVIYTPSNNPVWYSNTSKNPGAYLILRDDGHLAVVSPNGADIAILHRGSPDAYDRPSVYGNIESTGIFTDKRIPGDKFDKRTILDCINELKQVVGYNFLIDQDGAAKFESPNWWSAGNFDDLGAKIYVTYDEQGNFTRVNEGDPGAELFIPEISEAISLTGYSATLDGESLRSEIIIGSDFPDPDNPSATSYIKYAPGSATDEIRPGVPALRNIVRPAIWIDNTFKDKEEQRIMAELINLQIWFSQRTGSVTCIANPNLCINDQIRIIERNTSETYIHYVRGISSSMDLDSGQYVMTLTTNWLGNEDGEWVITSQKPDDLINPIKNISISERIDRWQQTTGRNLQFSGYGRKPATLSGGFVET